MSLFRLSLNFAALTRWAPKGVTPALVLAFMMSCSGSMLAVDANADRHQDALPPPGLPRLIPETGIMHCAGQSGDAFDSYWNALSGGHKPMVFMAYWNLDESGGSPAAWVQAIEDELAKYPGAFVTLQVGLAMTHDPDPSTHYEADVALGALDPQIDDFLDALEDLSRPVYLRIGYEFNGTSWNGYEPASFREAFRRVTDRIRARNLEVATVWDYAPEGVSNYLDFYPGDDDVDLWAINLFGASHISAPLSSQFVEDAQTHGKAVMIGESTPQHVGVQDGQASWDGWFAPYFSFVHAHPSIKMFCYIDWNWATYPEWADWGDARIETNPVVNGLYDLELAQPDYINAQSETAFRQRLGYGDTTPPPPVTGLGVDTSTVTTLGWQSVNDDSGIAAYLVSRNHQPAGRTVKPLFIDWIGRVAESVHYEVTAMDRAGNLSTATALDVVLPNALERVQNGLFEKGKKGWNLATYNGAVASWHLDHLSPISGSTSAVVEVTGATGTSWHIQLNQRIALHAGMTYRVHFSARSGSAGMIDLVVQKNAAPFTVYFAQPVVIDGNTTSYSYTFLQTVDDVGNASFMLGASNNTITLDDVSIIEMAR